jgi:tellurite resistance protein
MLGAAVMSKFEQHPTQSSAVVLRAGIPIAKADGGYFIVR